MKAKGPSKTVLNLRPIGVVRSEMRLKFDAPQQPDPNDRRRAVVELHPGLNFEQALKDLEGFERIWLIWWFDRNREHWRPMVMPPRGPAKKRGVFATRSPHRPNPLGMSAVELIAVRGRTLEIGAHDLVDGTPILDIKPYLPSIDSFPEAGTGWLTEVERRYAAAPPYRVELSELAAEQSDWLRRRKIDFLPRAIELLRRDPTPHRTRRIKRYDSRLFQMGCGAWRAYFSVRDATVLVERFSPGYPIRQLEGPASVEIADKDAQRDFGRRWPFD